MCGIIGCVNVSQLVAGKMLSCLSHRGPDDSGLDVTNKSKKGDVVLGQRRLSILDLSASGHQPMYYSKKGGACSVRYNKKDISKSNVSIVFNGEIYNYIEIRDELAKKGYVFTTGSDTEVILASYLEWGQKCVLRFNGMWAFCIHDVIAKELFLSRDRFGVKPLYYFAGSHNDVDKFMFASELKAFDPVINLRKHELDSVALEHYLSLGFIPAPWTIYKNIKKLEAGHNIIYSLTKKSVKISKYYDLPNFAPQKISENEVEELIGDAVKLRLRSDVEVGAYLSGGIDSSLIVSKMNELMPKGSFHTFSIGFSGRYDETPAINEVKSIFGTKHHHWYFERADFDKLQSTYAQIFDEPFADTSGFPTAYLNKNSKSYATVILSGDGGDEVFGGYSRHRIALFLSQLKKIPRPILTVLKSANSLGKGAKNADINRAFDLALASISTYHQKSAGESLANSPNTSKWLAQRFVDAHNKSDGSLVETVRIFDLLTLTLSDHFLTKVDRASMRSAVEVRCPFLDYRVVELGQRLPTKQKVSLFSTKKVLRNIASRNISSSIANRAKQGFEPPIIEWLWDEKPSISSAQFLANSQVPKLGAYIESTIRENAGKHNSISQILFMRMFLLQLWIKEWRV